MARIISIHSFRGGTGKSNATANIAALLAAEGQRVGVVDTDIQSPGIHVLFGMEDQSAMPYALNDYLRGNAEIGKVAYDVTEKLGNLKGRVYLIPSSVKPGEITHILREGYDVRRLNEGFRGLIKELNLDTLVIDTHPGLNEETLLSITISSALAIVLRPDRQDYQGTGVTVHIAQRLSVPNIYLIVNKVPAAMNADAIKKQVEETYHVPVAAVLPHSDDVMMLASEGVFVLRYPDHPITAGFKKITSLLMQSPELKQSGVRQDNTK
jgi:MinD-like ATPase involved in chromosome partitioning or flagellar assembly